MFPGRLPELDGQELRDGVRQQAQHRPHCIVMCDPDPEVDSKCMEEAMKLGDEVCDTSWSDCTTYT